MSGSDLDQQNKALPRRGFLRLLAIGAGAALLSACQRALETLVPTPSPTATGSSTLTPTHTLTLTPTPTTTETPAFTPTVTITPTETPTPTETQVPNIIFQDDFENGLGKWHNILQQGATVETIPDPTNSRSGKILKCTLNGIDSRPVRGYPDWYNGGYSTPKNIPGSCGILVDVLASNDLSGGNPPWKILNNYFFKGKEGSDNGVAVLVATRNGAPLDLKFNGVTVHCKTPFTYGKWVNGLEIRQYKGKVYVYRNGVLDIDPRNAITVPSTLEEGTMGGHAGAYITYWNGEGTQLAKGAYVLNDNFMVVQYTY